MVARHQSAGKGQRQCDDGTCAEHIRSRSGAGGRDLRRSLHGGCPRFSVPGPRRMGEGPARPGHTWSPGRAAGGRGSLGGCDYRSARRRRSRPRHAASTIHSRGEGKFLSQRGRQLSGTSLRAAVPLRYLGDAPVPRRPERRPRFLERPGPRGPGCLGAERQALGRDQTSGATALWDAIADACALPVCSKRSARLYDRLEPAWDPVHGRVRQQHLRHADPRRPCPLQNRGSGKRRERAERLDRQRQ